MSVPKIADCLICGQPGELRHSMDGSALVRCPNVCMVTELRAGMADEAAVSLWNSVMGTTKEAANG